MPNKQEAIKFLKTYMAKSSFFHTTKARIALNQEQKDYETLLGRVFKNPDDKMADLYFDKIEFLNQQKLAQTQWQKGHGELGHDFDKDMCLKSVLTYFETLDLLKNYALKATVRKVQTKDEDKKAYYAYEVESAKFYTDLYLKNIRDMINMNLSENDDGSENVYPISEKYRGYVDDCYKNAQRADFDHKKKYIDSYKKIYEIACQI